jgi:hypothetical protein
VIPVYLEIGSKRTIASALEWPGWCRSGRDEPSALEALAAYGVRYGRLAHAAHISFKAPAGSAAFDVVERIKGGATTDFGALEAIPAIDKEPFGAAELHRSQALLRAAWRAFDAAVAAAQGKTLSSGPRGGGRDLDHILEHVIGADRGHLSRLGRTYTPSPHQEPVQQLAELREALLEALQAGAQGDIPATGPRGGKRAPVRFFVRRALWHLLDHTWEIEDRSASKAR